MIQPLNLHCTGSVVGGAAITVRVLFFVKKGYPKRISLDIL